MKSTRKSLTAVFLILPAVLIVAQAGQARVQAWEGTITIPTYGWEEDVNPKFWALEGAAKGSKTVKASIVYPYSMQDHLYRTKDDRTYKALFLENDYLQITCLPELGGRLHSVVDKTQGEEVFHLNRVIKPSMIAMRGAFISGGVEWNAGPQVHTVTILSPVDVLLGENPDGSAYLEVNNLEKSLRTQWTVRLTLHPGKAYLDERIRIFNPTDGMQPYYFWNCTAFPNRNGTRFIYPMTLGTDHYGVKFFSWPVHEGKDLSWLKNHERSASVFAVDCAFDFFGAYDVDRDRGVVQVADHYQLPGKKAWTWGNWEYGRVNQQNLTDDDGAYIEVQSGPLPTQSDYGMLSPRGDIAWQEWWYPVHDLGEGFEYATKDIAAQASREDGRLRLKIIATGEYPQAICTLARPGRKAVVRRIDLSPREAQTLSLEVEGNTPVDVTIDSREGQRLAVFTTPLPIPEIVPPPPDPLADKKDEELTVEETYLRGERFDRSTRRKRARKYYEMALQKDPSHLPTLRALAILDFEAALYPEAAERLEKALSRKPNDDGLAWYFLGASHFRLGNLEKALRCAYQASKCHGAYSLGNDLAGRVRMRRGEHALAAEAFQRAAESNPRDPKARNHWLLALDASGNRRDALSQAKEWIVKAPTDLVPRALVALQDKSEMKRFVREAREFVGEDDFEMIETSLFFAEVGRFAEAARLLSAFCAEAVPQSEQSPLPLYYLAYYHALQDEEKTAREYLNQAAGMYRDFVFPSRPQAVEVFQYATDANPEDAYAHFHWGNLLGNLGRLEKAVAHWKRAVELDPTLSVAFRNLGLDAWVQNDLAQARSYYRQAIEARPEDQTLYRDLAEILAEDQARPEAIRLLETMPVGKTRRAQITIFLAQAYLDEKRYTDTLDLLASTPYFVHWEGSSITWTIFNDALLKRGKDLFEQDRFEEALQDFEAAMTYPENLGVGRPDKLEQAQEQYWRGKALQALGRIEAARAAWKTGAGAEEGSDKQNKHRQLCRQALSELNAEP